MSFLSAKNTFFTDFMGKYRVPSRIQEYIRLSQLTGIVSREAIACKRRKLHAEQEVELGHQEGI